MIAVDGFAIPVVSIRPSSLMASHASWILQRAAKSESRADSLFEHCQDRAVQGECLRQGWVASELDLARCTKDGYKEIRAIGRSGKRSTMLALGVALIFFAGAREYEDLFREMRIHGLMDTFDSIMQDAFDSITLLRRVRTGPLGKKRRLEDAPLHHGLSEADEEQSE